jgi:hypothetical protein
MLPLLLILMNPLKDPSMQALAKPACSLTNISVNRTAEGTVVAHALEKSLTY